MNGQKILVSFALVWGTLGLGPAWAAAAEPVRPVRGLSPQESLATFQLPPGYRLELVLGDEQINDPVVIAFDGNGSMFVAEMRTYMEDADGTGQHTPRSRVSLHTSTRGDGVYDRHTVFADNLVLPRIILPLDQGQLIIGESDTLDLHLYTDTNGDGVADKKELWYEGGRYPLNVEHQPSGLIWAADNWLYTTVNAYRLRWTPGGGWLKEATPPNEGQWGLTQDDWGKPWPMNARGERGPVNFQVPIIYGTYRVEGDLAPGFAEVWPLPGIADVQGGYARFRATDKTLNHFTATSGADIYRGDRLPAELRGDLFFADPVGRLIRRAQVEIKEGVTRLSNPYQPDKSEFIRSSDLCFRPVNMTTAPDGTLYIVDMYRGVIQEAVAVKPGSYLRDIVDRYEMANVIRRGRVWRLVHESARPGPMPRMFGESGAQLIAHFASPNGWWRDTAQKLIVLRQDRSVVPELIRMVQGHSQALARLHALWTLEGLGALTSDLVRRALADPHPGLRGAAIRAGETLIKSGDASLQRDVLALARDRDAGVVIQALLTAKRLGWPETPRLAARAMEEHSAQGVREIGGQILHPREQRTPGLQFSPAQERVIARGEQIYNTLCISCHGADGKGVPLPEQGPRATLAPALSRSQIVTGREEGAIAVMLHGMTGRNFPGQMSPMGGDDDAWIAAVLSFLRNSFVNSAGFISPEQVAQVRAATSDRTQPWKLDELRRQLPLPLSRSRWKPRANYNPASAALAIDDNVPSRYHSEAPQALGMWFQVELEEARTVTAIRLEAGSSPEDYPRHFRVETSLDGITWDLPVETGSGQRTVTDIAFRPSRAKYIRITLTKPAKASWSIHEMQVYAAPAAGTPLLSYGK